MATEEAEKMMTLFSSRLASLLRESNMAQSELANMLGVSKSTVNKWIMRRSVPRMGLIEKMSSIFGVPKSFFLEESTGDKRTYYFDPETARLAQEIHDNPQYKVLFDATKHLKPESVKEVMRFIDYQKSKEGGE